MLKLESLHLPRGYSSLNLLQGLLSTAISHDYS